jgi:hypothetical protein
VQQWRLAGAGLVFFGILFVIAGINRMRLELSGRFSVAGMVIGVIASLGGLGMCVLGLLVAARI